MSDLSQSTRIEGFHASKLIRKFAGVSLAAAAIGLWTLAGAPVAASDLAVQTVLTAVFGFGAIAFLSR